MYQFDKFNKWQQNFHKFLDDDFWIDFKDIMFDKGPKVNIYESGNEVICLIFLPGLKDVNSVNLFTYKQVLEISGKLQFHIPHFRLIQEELLQGDFKRSIELPFPVRDDKIEATYHHGILTVHLHRLLSNPEHRNRISIKNLEEQK